MRFLVDQDVYMMTVQYLRELRHDVITAKELGMQEEADTELIKQAKELSRILITRDKDFGMLVFVKEELSTGVILLRINPVTVNAVHRELNRLINEHTEEELTHLFCVVEPHRHRIRHLFS